MHRTKQFLLLMGLAVCFMLCGASALADDMPDVWASTSSFFDYSAGLADGVSPNGEIVLTPGDIADLHDSGAYVDGNVLQWASGIGRTDWAFTVETAGWYQLEISFLALPSRQGDIMMSLALDGAYPFTEAKQLTLRRLYQAEGPITRDSRDNDLKPKLSEAQIWQTVFFQDIENHYANPYSFYLTAGEHVLNLGLSEEALAISQLRFVNIAALPSYEAYIAAHADAAQNNKNASVSFQAEEPGLRNSMVLYPISQRGDAATQPSDPVKTRLNTIGGGSWKAQGEWMEWTFTVPADGFYKIHMRVLQNFLRGMGSTRSISIDGQIPFAEAEHLFVPYKSEWYIYTAQDVDGNEFDFYLTAGEHTLRMTVTAGPYSEPLRQMEEMLSEISTMYRKVIMISGDNADYERVTIDRNRDFQLETKIPSLLEDMTRLAKELRACQAEIERYGSKGSSAAVLTQMAVRLENFIKHPEDIVLQLEGWKTDISGLATQGLRLREQALQVDYFVVADASLKAPNQGVGFFEQAAFRWNGFIGSFFEDYTAMGEIYDTDEQVQPLVVWVCANDLGSSGIASGREQTQLIKEMIDQYFVPENSIPVNVSLIDGSGTLMQAILGGKGPDVAITVYKELPVNLAMRGALVELSQFEGFEALKSQFMASALVPYTYKGGIYALPETQNFDVIFYRTDIFAELGLTVPNTWEDVRALLPVLQKQGMTMGIPSPTVTNSNTMGFQAQLFQRGISFYTEDLSQTTFDQPLALEAFKAWTELYSKYALPVKYDFFSRFRTGTMPIAIDMYTTANQLAVAAPELQGLWDIAPIPGSMLNGELNRGEGATGTGAVIISTSKQQENAFKFISWWTGADTQTEFGLGVESLMGAAARWPTANIEAFQNMKWTSAQREALWEQWQFVQDIPQLPGNYITNRTLAFAFRAVVYKNNNLREVLNKYNKDINKEIQRKWEEFGY